MWTQLTKFTKNLSQEFFLLMTSPTRNTMSCTVSHCGPTQIQKILTANRSQEQMCNNWHKYLMKTYSTTGLNSLLISTPEYIIIHNTDCCLLGCSPMYTSVSLPLFQMSVLPPSLGQWVSCKSLVRDKETSQSRQSLGQTCGEGGQD
jgi:hypothetical protein